LCSLPVLLLIVTAADLRLVPGLDGYRAIGADLALASLGVFVVAATARGAASLRFRGTRRAGAG
jgi:hypothetical protein